MPARYAMITGETRLSPNNDFEVKGLTDEDNKEIIFNVANNIQEFFEDYLRNTDDEVFNRISKRIGEQNPKLFTHLITNNQLII